MNRRLERGGPMQKKVKALAIGTGVLAAGAAVTTGVSYTVTNVLVKEALDRDEPRIMRILKRRVNGTFKETEAYRTALHLAEMLERKPHKQVEIEAQDGIKLIGHWFGKDDAVRVIIAMHGWRSTWSSDFGAIADFWFENHCSVLFVEQRGQGESGGRYMGFGMLERYDCKEWINWVNARMKKALPIYLAGVSMGATSVLMATELDLPDNVHGIIADCGFTSARAIWKHVCENGMHLSYRVRQKMIDDLCLKRIHFLSDDCSSVDAMKKNTVPVLFVHGADDTFVPVTMTYDNYKACSSPKHLLIVPGADHGLSYFVEKDKYETIINEFWERYDRTPVREQDIENESEDTPSIDHDSELNYQFAKTGNNLL